MPRFSLLPVIRLPGSPFSSRLGLLVCVLLAGFAQEPQRGRALLAKALFAAFRRIAMTHAHAPLARSAVEHHIGYIDRHLTGKPSPLGILPIRLQMLVNLVDAFD